MKDYQLQVSIGINTAMMTVGEIQTQLHNEYTAYGNDINLAKRLQESAEPNQILVGAGSYRLTRRAFDFDVIPDLTVKGFTHPVTAYSVRQVKVHPEKLRGIEGLSARMIGREHEFTDLKEATDEWLSGHGQIISIVGEAGIGKSRLVTELKQYLKKNENSELHPSSFIPHPFLEGRCVSIGQPISYWPFIDILKTYFNLSEGDDGTTIARKVTDSITQMMPQSVDETLPLLGQLLSIKYGNELDDRLKFATPEQIRHQTLMRLRDIFTTLARKQPLLLILEDLHWSDDLSLDLISLLMDELANTSLMLLCVYRPEHDHRVWQLGDQARRKCMDRYTEIMLKPLSSGESRELIESLLEIDNLPDATKSMIMDKSEGNPFFIEEVIRSLIEQGMIYQQDDRWVARDEIATIDVPDTIQSVILSRVDRLQAEAKYVLQCASVIGRLFKHRLLDHLTQHERELNRYISEFEDRELVYQERMIPELEYAFKHALTQEATYQSILERKRKDFHLQVAQGIEGLYQERLEEYYEELAEHYSKSDDEEKTIEYLLKAGNKAQSMSANEYAIRCFEKAIFLIDKMFDTKEHKEQKLDTLSKLVKVYFTIGQNDRAVEIAENAIEIAEEISTPRMVASIYYKIADSLLVLHKLEEALAWSENGLEILGDDKICPEAALLNYSAWMAYGFLGNGSKSKEYQDKNVDMIREIGYFDEIYNIYNGFICSSVKGEDAIAWARELIEVCIRHNNQIGLAEGYIYLGIYSYYGRIGTLSEFIEYFTKGLVIAKRIGYMLFVLFGSYYLGLMLIEAGDKIEAEKHLREAVGIMESWKRQQELTSVYAYKFLADILAERGELEQACSYLAKGLRLTLSNYEIQDFLTYLKDSCKKMGKPEEFIALCNSELEKRDKYEEKQIIKNALADFQN